MKKSIRVVVFLFVIAILPGWFQGFNSGTGNSYYLRLSSLAWANNSCGAFVAPGVWKEFDCYNLAAIGKTTNDDPFTPSWRLIGGYWQWGRKGPDPSQWYDTNTPNFAHGPTGPGSGVVNSDRIINWDYDFAPDGAWRDSDGKKTDNDPCPTGYRVPTKNDWDDVLANNDKVYVGSTWTSNPTNYGTGLRLGEALFLPAAGVRTHMYWGALDYRGNHGAYWSSSENESHSAWNLGISTWNLGISDGIADTFNNNRKSGFTVRCIATDVGAFVTRFYQQCLRREPDPGGLAHWANTLNSGIMSGADLAWSFIYSGEFQNSGTTDDEYLNVLYRAFFNREPDQSGYNHWLSLMAGGTDRATVLDGFTSAQEFITLCDNYGIQAGDAQTTDVEAFVTRFYQQCLGREPDAAGLAHWVDTLNSGSASGADLAWSFIYSGEFQNSGTTDDEYLNVLYRAFFNREPDQGGYNHWLSLMAGGTDRATVLDGFTSAQEFITLCDNYGIQAASFCTYSISPSSGSFTASGGTSVISVTASSSSCDWTASESLFWVSLSSTSGIGTGAISVTATANTGAARSGSIVIEGKTYTISQEAAGTSSKCGAYVAPGVWKEFDCYNLAAIGKTTNDDPFTPTWRLFGGHWQWGRKGPDARHWYDTNTSHFAHGPTGPEENDKPKKEDIIGWDTTSAPDGSWSDSNKMPNDPCPVDYRVPTRSQWEGIINNNPLRKVGIWTEAWQEPNSPTNYSSAQFFGNSLMLPAAGSRTWYSGWPNGRNSSGTYWSSSLHPIYNAYSLLFDGVNSPITSEMDLNTKGKSVRCIAE